MIHKKNVLTIAGSDSSGGAGIQADIKTFEALNIYGASVITAITAQNTLGVTAVHEVPNDNFASQLEAVLTDIHFDAIKIGMLKGVAHVNLLAEFVNRYELGNIVLDPVMVSTSGHILQDPEATEVMTKQLMPMARLLTPNIPEAAYLLNVDEAAIRNNPQSASEQLLRRFSLNAVLLKGGHGKGNVVTDVLCHKAGTDNTQIEFRIYEYKKQDTLNIHGTGCTLSSAIASFLAQGADLTSAVDAAGRYLQVCLANASQQQVGKGNGPVNHRAGGILQ